MTTLEQRRRELTEAIAEEWEYELRESPEFATTIGDYRYNDRWSDLSLEHVDERKRDLSAWLARFRAIDTGGFPPGEQLHHRLMVRSLEERLEDIEFKSHEMPVDQLDGIHLVLAQFVAIAPFDSAVHYEEYIVRLHALPKLLDQVTEVLGQGRKDRLMPPRYLLEKTVEQCRAIAEPAGEANVFGRPGAEIPESVPRADRERIRAELVKAVDGLVRPAYSKLADFLATEYAPAGRTKPGIWSLPDGDARYRFAVRRFTTTDLDPQTIHELGLEEVARVEAEQAAIAQSLGFSDLRSFRISLRSDPRLVPGSRQEILDVYRRYVQQMNEALPSLFGLLPTCPFELRPVQEYREKEAAGAEYYPGTPDGSRPGIVYVNTGDHGHRTLAGAEATAYHEAIPGHHLQVSIAQTLPDMPPFRQHAYYGAYTEGWALYAERLGKEIGFYEDPYSDFGRLSEELLRAARLVLDTGLHHKRWTRQQAVDYFREHSSADEPDLQAEVDRYIVLPAQALTYKLGQLEILKLRARAQTELGPRYDVRAFNDKILDGGALPLDVLGERVGAWIEQQRAVPRGASPPAGALL
jgi:uncharacterized protein (DUF885 family)